MTTIQTTDYWEVLLLVKMFAFQKNKKQKTKKPIEGVPLFGKIKYDSIIFRCLL